MAGFKLTAFGGFVPRVSPTLLQDNEATRALNTKLYSGALMSWKKPAEVVPPVNNLIADVRTIHKVSKGGDDLWFAWATDVNVVKGPLIDSQDFRIYYTGDGYPKKTNASLAGTTSGGNPASFLSMGVPSPTLAPTVARVGSGGSPETRVYVYTYISEFGDIFEESGPSPVSAEVDCGSGDTVTVDGFGYTATYSQTGTTITITETAHGLSTGQRVFIDFTSGGAPDGWYDVTRVDANEYTVVAPTASTSGNCRILVKAPAGRYNITKLRIYRSLSGTGSTTFNFVEEIALGTSSYTDDKTSAQLGEVIKSLDYEMPPADLKGLVEMPNGILAGFVGREVFFCEPYLPHTWPTKYSITVEDEIVGLGVFGQSLAVLTKGNPYMISGITSEAMSSEKIAIVEPCVSAGTIVSDSQGVTYASPNGLIELGPSGPVMITRNVMLKDEFAQYNPIGAFAEGTQGRYYMFFDSAPGELERGVLVFDRNLPNTPLTISTLIADCAFVDKSTGLMYIVEGGKIKEWDSDEYNQIPYEWTSKEFILPQPVNLGAVEVYADFDDIGLGEQLQQAVEQIIASNQAIFASASDLLGEINDAQLNAFQFNGSILASIPPAVDDRFVQMIVYADGEEKQRLEMTERKVYRLISGYKSDRYKFTLSGNVPLRHVKIAETTKELRTL